MVGVTLLILACFLFLKKHFVPSLIIFFIFVTNGFQIIPVVWLTYGLPIDKGTDLALLFIIFITIKNLKYLNKLYLEYNIYKWCLYVILFIFSSAIYSFFILNYSLTNIIQVSRPYLFLLSFVFFFSFPIKSLTKILHILCTITVIQSILFLFQIVSNQTILLSANGTQNVTTNILSGYTRFYNTPIFISTALFYFIYAYSFKWNFLKYLIITILILAIIGPLHRSFIIAIIASLSIFTLIKKSSSLKIVYISIIGLALYILSFNDLLSKRINETFTDLETTFSSELTVTGIDIKENTTLFRIGHFLERYDYVIKRPLGWLWGLGLISDNSKDAVKLPFKFGLESSITGQVVKIDTADLIWSPLIINLGIVGTCIYIYLFYKLLIFFYQRTKYSLAVVGFLTVLNAFLISMTGIEMLSITFRVVVLMLSVILIKQKHSNTMKKKLINIEI